VRDWNALVRERLSGLGFTDAQQSEVIAELGAHLEDLYEEQRALGVNEIDAIRRALDEVTDWRLLARNIRHSKNQEEQMNIRVKSLWLPGLASLSTAIVALSIVNRIGIQPKIIWYGSTVGLELYFPWLMTLPVFGGLGAYLSQRAHGEVQARLAAALFPVIFLSGLFCTILMFSGLIERHLTWRALPVAFALTILNWVLIPGAALALGALPFLRTSHLRETGQSSC
jgi:hypothetical protein